MDPHGDHLYTCPKVCKVPAHDKIRDTLAEQLREILPMINLVDSPTMVEIEPVGMILELPHLRPYDVYITLGHTIANSPYKALLSLIGFGVTVPNPLLVPQRVPPSLVAHKNKPQMRLREAERLKYQRNGKTNKDSMITFSGEDIFQRINKNEDTFIPAPFLPGGMPGGVFSQFFYGTTPLPLLTDNFDNRPQAVEAARRAISHHVPSGILLEANDAWRRSQLTTTIARRTQLTPMDKFVRALGLTLALAFSNHILQSYNKVKHKQPLACTCNDPHTGCAPFPIPPTQTTDSPNHSNTDNTDNSRPQTGLPNNVFEEMI